MVAAKLARKKGAIHPKTKAKSAGAVIDLLSLVGQVGLDRMRRGLPAKTVVDTAKMLGISRYELYKALRLPRTTTEARVASKKPLNAIGTDRVFRVIRVVTCAARVFEDEAVVKTWILEEHRPLGFVTPLSLLDTELGYELVLNYIGQIEYGVYS